MAYNTPSAVSAGSTWTADDWNMYVRGNFAAGIPAIFTERGDIAVATAADAASRLGIGRDNQVLIADSAQSTGVRWGGPGHFARYRDTGAGSSFTSGNTVIFQFNTQVFDLSSAVTTGAAWKYTAPVAGYYAVSVSAEFNFPNAVAVNKMLNLILYKNGSADSYLSSAYIQATDRPTLYFTLFGAGGINLAAGNYVDVRVNQDTGSTMTAITSTTHSESNWISVCRLF